MKFLHLGGVWSRASGFSGNGRNGNENGNENGKGRQDCTFCGIGRRSCKQLCIAYGSVQAEAGCHEVPAQTQKVQQAMQRNQR